MEARQTCATSSDASPLLLHYADVQSKAEESGDKCGGKGASEARDEQQSEADVDGCDGVHVLRVGVTLELEGVEGASEGVVAASEARETCEQKEAYQESGTSNVDGRQHGTATNGKAGGK